MAVRCGLHQQAQTWEDQEEKRGMQEGKEKVRLFFKWGCRDLPTGKESTIVSVSWHLASFKN